MRFRSNCAFELNHAGANAFTLEMLEHALGDIKELDAPRS